MQIGNLLPMIVLGNKASGKAKNAAILQMFGGKGGQAKLISDISTFTALKEIDKSEKSTKAQVTVLATEQVALTENVEAYLNVGARIIESTLKQTGDENEATFNAERSKAVVQKLKDVENIDEINVDVLKDKLKAEGVSETAIKTRITAPIPPRSSPPDVERLVNVAAEIIDAAFKKPNGDPIDKEKLKQLVNILKDGDANVPVSKEIIRAKMPEAELQDSDFANLD